MSQRKRYDATHKKMVRLVRDWNKLEEFREAGHAPATIDGELSAKAIGRPA